MKRFLLTALFLTAFLQPFLSHSQEPVISDTFLTPTDTAQAVEKKSISLEELIRKNETYTIALNHINAGLARKIDTLALYEELPRIEQVIETVGERLQYRESSLNLRYLGALENLVVNFKTQVDAWQQTITERNKSLNSIGAEISAIKDDEDLRFALRDTTLLPEYQKQAELLRNRLNKVDSSYHAQRLKLARAQSRVSSTIITLNDFEEEIDERQRQLERRLFAKENNFIWESPDYLEQKRVRYLMKESIALNELILSKYLRDNAYRHFIISIFALGFFIWFTVLLNRIKKEKDFAAIILERVSFIPTSPILSTLLAILPLAPFFYLNPPTVFVQLILTATAGVATLLIFKSLDRKALYFWIGLLGIFLCYSFSNLYVEIAFKERWFLLFLNLAGISLAYLAIRVLESKPEKYPKYINFFIYLYFSMQVISFLANILGRYSLSKMLGVASTNSLVQAITLYAFVTIILEAIYLQLELGKNNQKEFASYFDFKSIRKRLKNFLVGISSIIWVYYFTSNLNIYEYLSLQIGEVLTTERHLGSFSFTLGSILVFIVLIWASSLLARNIAYFAEMKDEAKASSRTQRLGSSILLIRLAVLTTGFLLAITASGISLEKAAIVLGALSVGIGFGLQTIVNNLVSGVILAFERPIQIGDMIEIGNRGGTVKEIGIRASKIKAYDGSEVIIPNGDLLSEHLINWTLSDKTRRVELFIGVAYGSDSDKVTDILEKVMEHEGILTVPKPAVYLQTFADSAVEFRMLFWVGDISTWIAIRSQIMTAIYKAFAEHKIEIPFPQRDLHIKSYPKEDFLRKELIRGKPTEGKDDG
ncbi:mechanosensitive ion channel [Litoribacter alkaliphilus]|uniref:Mechanosensitive ion channel n=1 Tax=Litoribacter ruber TaxID=702568 RepID=A0AAP2G2Z6_9BACT|nr:mechanosensitive ion channel domain-containing protein [Litoribacter alkaliphilus]MBS9522531.1 mechanosensitive ion channel [Litoribacter alkaliphilus]